MRDTQRHAAIEFLGQVKMDRPAADLAILNIVFFFHIARINKDGLIFATIRTVNTLLFKKHVRGLP
ncbi:hypothetical protein A3746_25555 [Oleibacter sp. HI0075]|nr:hypothetical protein A3746_03810 [Oleibacter sp. HI0075]KZZ12421.1 hypothetical protein A3746_25555 [Oleibacter sp. HI0075]